MARAEESRSPPEQTASPGMTIGTVLVFYGLLAGAAIGWDALRSGPSGLALADGQRWPGDAALGAGAGLVVVLASRAMSRLSQTARALEADLAQALGRLSGPTILVAALASGIGEELFFRGAMQPSLGYVATSLIFGAVHGFFVPRLWLWSTFAMAMGFLLGWMVLETGNLLAPILTHVVVNYLNLHALNRRHAVPQPEVPS